MNQPSPEYQRFLRNLERSDARTRVAGLLTELHRLDAKLGRAFDGKRNVPSLADDRRAAARIERLELQEQRLLAALDQYPPEYVEAIRTLTQRTRR